MSNTDLEAFIVMAKKQLVLLEHNIVVFGQPSARVKNAALRRTQAMAFHKTAFTPKRRLETDNRTLAWKGLRRAV